MRTFKSGAARHEGFTLIELMVVVTVIAILAAIAYPSYLESIAKSRRAEARAQLLEAMQYMQRFYSQNDRFDLAIGSTTPMTLPASLAVVPRTGTPTYAIAFEPGTLAAGSFTLQATPMGAMANDRCGTLSISNAGRRQVVDQPAGSTATVNDCWR